jgi:hypothetical protein
LLVGVGLSFVLGPRFGMAGIAGAFLVGTGFGTLYPLIRDYARRAEFSVVVLLRQIWWRAGVAFCLSWAAAHWAMRWFGDGWRAVAAGVIGLVIGLSAALLLLLVRRGRRSEPGAGWEWRRLMREI